MFDNTYEVPGCTQLGTGATAVLPTKLWYFFRAPRSNSDSTVVIKRTTFDTSFVDAEAFRNADAWAAPIEVKVPPLAGYADSVTSGQPLEGSPITGAQGVFALTRNNSIFLFWIDASGNVFGTKSAGDDLWTPGFQLQGVQVLAGNPTELSGYVFKDKVVLAWGAHFEGNTAFLANAFSESNIQPSPTGTGQVWAPDLERPASIIQLNSNNVPQGSPSMAWTVLPCALGIDGEPLGQTGSEDMGSAPVSFLSVNVRDSFSGVLHRMVMTSLIDPDTGVPGKSYASSLSLASGDLVTLDLDASNTMYLYSLTTGNQVQRQPLMSAAGALELGATSPVLTHNEPLVSMSTPRLGYVAATPRPGQLKTSSAPDAAVLTTVATDLYRFIFVAPSSNSSSVQVAIQFYGTRHVVATVNDLYVKDEVNPNARQQALVAKGIVDGPLPVPGQNLRMMSQGGTVTEWDLFKPIGHVTYGTSDSDDSTHEVTVQGAVGADVSFQGAVGVDLETTVSVSGGLAGFLDIGVSTNGLSVKEMFGVNLGYSYAKATQEILRQGRATVREANVVGLTRVLPDGVPSADAPPVLSTQGFISGAALSVHSLAIAFENPRNPGVLPSRPSYISFMPSTRVQLGTQYTADYAFTPGDLTSYAPSAVNERMAAAYNAWREANPNEEDPFGEDYNSYFEKVVDACALHIGPGGRNFLEFTVTNDGITEARFDLTEHTFKEWGVTVDNSFYAAATWENLLNVAGWELQSYLEAGASFEFGASHRKDTERSERWGISASLENFPQATHAGHVCGYTFRLYLLPSDNRWTQELICFSDYAEQPANGIKPLNPSSKPWKIMFFVDPASIMTLA